MLLMVEIYILRRAFETLVKGLVTEYVVQDAEEPPANCFTASRHPRPKPLLLTEYCIRSVMGKFDPLPMYRQGYQQGPHTPSHRLLARIKRQTFALNYSTNY